MAASVLTESAGPPLHALILDDDRVARQMLARLLQRELDCDVSEAADGLEAAVCLEARRVDLLFLDLNLPFLDGRGILELVRADKRFADLPVVAISGEADREMVLELIRLGIEDYLMKPHTPADTVKRVGPVLTKARRRPATGPRRQVLVVDRDPEFRAPVMACGGAFVSVAEAESVEAGLRAAARQTPDIVLLGELPEGPIGAEAAWAAFGALVSEGGRVVRLGPAEGNEPTLERTGSVDDFRPAFERLVIGPRWSPLPGLAVAHGAHQLLAEELKRADLPLAEAEAEAAPAWRWTRDGRGPSAVTALELPAGIHLEPHLLKSMIEGWLGERAGVVDLKLSIAPCPAPEGSPVLTAEFPLPGGLTGRLATYRG